jgi:hypothetical protein
MASTGSPVADMEDIDATEQRPYSFPEAGTSTFDGEPKKDEAESWRRAIQLTAGWEKEALRDDPPEHPYEVPDYAKVPARQRRTGGSG